MGLKFYDFHGFQPKMYDFVIQSGVAEAGWQGGRRIARRRAALLLANPDFQTLHHPCQCITRQGRSRLVGGVDSCPSRFWQISYPYLNQRGQIMPPTHITTCPPSFRQVPTSLYHKGPSINYVVSGGGGGQKMPNLLSKKTTRRGAGGQKSPILRQHSLRTAPN